MIYNGQKGCGIFFFQRAMVFGMGMGQDGTYHTLLLGLGYTEQRNGWTLCGGRRGSKGGGNNAFLSLRKQINTMFHTCIEVPLQHLYCMATSRPMLPICCPKQR